jgi:hypothetical protein
MNLFTRWIGTVAVCLLVLLAARTTPATPQHDDSAVEGRSDHVMGFDHDKTTHHFTLTKTGGIIQVTANDSSDSASRDHIRMHLRRIAKAFSAGDFTDPHEVHAEDPPGVPVMKDRKDKISYQFESIAKGGRVAITTEDAKAVEAVHDYLRYQIREHKTGDSIAVQ